MILARLLSVTPQTDGEHWDVAGAYIQDVWGTDLFAQNPAPYQRNPQLGMPNRPPFPWRPDNLAAGSISELNGIYGFNLIVNTANSPTTLDIYGQVPVNALPTGFAPQCPFEATVSSTGGSIPPGSYVVKISGGVTGPVSQYFINAVVPAGTNTNTIIVSGVVWQTAAASIGVYVGTSSLNCHSILSGDWAGSSNDGFGNPTVFTIGAITEDGVGLPDPVFNSFLFQAKYIVHGGVWGSAATSVGSGTATFAGASWTTNEWAGYTLSSYAGPGSGFVGYQFNWTVVSNTANTLTFSGIHTPVVGAAVVMRAASTSITANTIGDPKFINSYAPGGLTVNAEAGNVLRIVAGTGAGQPEIAIESNTTTVFTLASNFAVMPDSTSIYIVCQAGWIYSQATSSIANAGTGTPFKVGSIPIVNFNAGSLLVEGITVDINGNWSVERYAPTREIYIPPIASATNPGFVPLTPVSGVVSIDVSLGAAFGVTLPASAFSVAIPTNAGGAAVAGQAFDLHLIQTTAHYPPPTFTGGAGGFVSSTNAQVAAVVSGVINTETVIGFRFKNGFWSVKTAQGSNSLS